MIDFLLKLFVTSTVFEKKKRMILEQLSVNLKGLSYNHEFFYFIGTSIIHGDKAAEIATVNEFINVILIITKFGENLLLISNCLSGCIQLSNQQKHFQSVSCILNS